MSRHLPLNLKLLPTRFSYFFFSFYSWSGQQQKSTYEQIVNGPHLQYLKTAEFSRFENICVSW